MITETAPHKASFALQGHNPDVLTCIANLSNDEVFTPPELANQILDTVADAWASDNDGASVWENPEVTFLDPFTKSGVFLREITKRLVEGLEEWEPDLQKRVDHILTRQVYGIGITRLTSLLARRSVYCSKDATGSHSIATEFDRDWGNIWFERTEHTWAGDRCAYCGASKSNYARESALETHAYAFIHTTDINKRLAHMFGADVQFDVIIGNPPYQLSSDGGTRDVPIYHRFVEQAKRMEPKLLSMVIQSRWMTSGLGLSEFRNTMLSDRHVRVLVDFPNSDDVFPGTGFRGGVCYFLRDATSAGQCAVLTSRGGETYGPIMRDLNEFDVFVRDARAVSVLEKVLAEQEPSVVSILSADKQFGWTSNFAGMHEAPNPGDVPVYYVRGSQRKIGYVARSDIPKSRDLVDTPKVLIPKAGSGGGVLPDYVLSRPELADSPSACTQTFLFFCVDDMLAARSLRTYLSTRFVRFLISMRKITQDATRGTYKWVPLQTWDRDWTDAELAQKYGLTPRETALIDAHIRSVDWGGGVGDQD